MMKGFPKASAVLIAVAAGFTVRPRAAKVAAGIDCARTTPAVVGQVIADVRTVQTSQLLVMRDPLVTLALPFVLLNGVATPVFALKLRFPGVKPNVIAGPLESVLMSYLFRNHSKPHLTVCLPAMFCRWALNS